MNGEGANKAYMTMEKEYRKKPVVIKAYQTDIEFDIETLEGTMTASVGDFIITGVHGEQYPCKPDIFYETYDLADENDIDRPLTCDLNEWNEILDWLNKSNRRISEIKEIYNEESYRILEEAREIKVDFKALYGGNNATTRKQYVDDQLVDLLNEKKELEFLIQEDTRRIYYLRELIRTKRFLQGVNLK